tara:strand:+ start:218 stop:481 length:264 start_codon:yes stop_codon:yes gene_type:complete
MTTNDKLIALLNKAVPEALAVCISQWDNSEESIGIWFRGSEDYASDNKRVFNYYSDGDMLHPKLEKLLAKYDYYVSPYDSGTVMAYK